MAESHTDASEAQDNLIRIRNSAHIPVGLNFLKDAALKLVNDNERAAMSDVIRMLRSLFHYESLEKRDRVKTNFTLANVQKGEERLVGYDEDSLGPVSFVR